MKKIIGSLLVMSTVFLSSCIAVTQNKDSETAQNPFIVYSIDSMPKDLIGLNKRSESEEDLIYTLFDGLISTDKNGNVTPDLADSWEISNDKLEYRFTIRDDAKWSDGSDIRAQDFVNFFSEILSKKVDNIFYSQLSCIYGVDDYHAGKIKADGLAIKAEGEKILVIRLNYPNVYFLKILSQPIYGLRSDVSKLQTWKKDYSNIKYSGPFMITNVDELNNVTLENNNYYWNNKEIVNSKFIVSEKVSKEAALAEYESSKIDIFTNPPISEVGRLIKNENTIIVNSSNKVGIAFNFSSKSIASDKNFRKALAAAIDSRNIAENALSEYKVASGGANGEAITVFKNTVKANTNSLNIAKDYIKKIDTAKLKNIRLIALNTDKNKRIGKALKENVESQLGVSIKVNLLESTELTEAINNKDFDIILTDFVVDYDEKMSLLEKWDSKSIDNLVKYSNENYDSNIRKIRLEQDSIIRKQYIEECKNILNEDLPSIYLFNDVKIISKGADISGLDVNAFGNLNLKNVHRNTR